jgi:hypothetical protein
MSLPNNYVSLYRQSELRKKLNATFTTNYFQKLNPDPEIGENVNKKVRLTLKPIFLLEDYLKECRKKEDKLKGLTIFVEKLIRLSNRISKDDKRYWGFIVFMRVNNEHISKYFSTVIDFLISNMKMTYPRDEYDGSFRIEGSELALSIFNIIYPLLEKSDNFLKYGGAYITDKYFELLNNNYIEGQKTIENDEKKIVYVADPVDYFPEEIRKEYKLGEFAE